MKKLFSKLFHKKKKEAHPFCSAIVAAAGSSRRMEGEMVWEKVFMYTTRPPSSMLWRVGMGRPVKRSSLS